MVWDAAIAAGATIEDLRKMDAGEYPPSLVAKLIAWYNGHRLIDAHSQDASMKASKK